MEWCCHAELEGIHLTTVLVERSYATCTAYQSLLLSPQACIPMYYVCQQHGASVSEATQRMV